MNLIAAYNDHTEIQSERIRRLPATRNLGFVLTPPAVCVR